MLWPSLCIVRHTHTQSKGFHGAIHTHITHLSAHPEKYYEASLTVCSSVCVFVYICAAYVSNTLQKADKSESVVAVFLCNVGVCTEVFTQQGISQRQQELSQSISKRNKEPWWSSQLPSSHLAFPLLCIFSIMENIYGSQACSLPIPPII